MGPASPAAPNSVVLEAPQDGGEDGGRGVSGLFRGGGGGRAGPRRVTASLWPGRRGSCASCQDCPCPRPRGGRDGDVGPVGLCSPRRSDPGLGRPENSPAEAAAHLHRLGFRPAEVAARSSPRRRKAPGPPRPLAASPAAASSNDRFASVPFTEFRSSEDDWRSCRPEAHGSEGGGPGAA